MNETELTVVGTLITGVERRHVADGAAVANFRVASNARRFDAASGGWTDGDTLYLSVTCWRQVADNAHSSLSLGDPVIVRGRLRTRSYDRDGRRHSVTELHATAIGPDLARATAEVRRGRRSGVGAPGSAAAGSPASGGAPAAPADPADRRGAAQGAVVTGDRSAPTDPRDGRDAGAPWSAPTASRAVAADHHVASATTPTDGSGEVVEAAVGV